ncbi:hypothetical protein [Demequina flava]|uniref:hypothetical protein n=1 Tax=Demequina flava TaxID=1095025 RepID=UPI0007852ABF|nr:hypothetical protein [Demequina flava]
MTSENDPQPPAGLRDRGERFWTRTLEYFDLEPGEIELLTEIARALDRLTDLDEAARRDGTMIESSQGMRLHPAIAEHRALSLATARMLSQLGLPDEDGTPTVVSAKSAAAKAREARLNEQSRIAR